MTIDFYWNTGSRLAVISKYIDDMLYTKSYSVTMLWQHIASNQWRRKSAVFKNHRNSLQVIRVTRGKVIKFMRGQSIFYYIFINGGRTKRNFVKTIYYFHPLFLILHVCCFPDGGRTKRLIIYRLCENSVFTNEKPTSPSKIFSHNYSLVA